MLKRYTGHDQSGRNGDFWNLCNLWVFKIASYWGVNYFCGSCAPQETLITESNDSWDDRSFNLLHEKLFDSVCFLLADGGVNIPCLFFYDFSSQENMLAFFPIGEMNGGEWLNCTKHSPISTLYLLEKYRTIPAKNSKRKKAYN